LVYLTQGIILGLYAAVMPGPLQFFLFSQTLRIGWRRTLPGALAPLLSDLPILLVLLLLLSQAPAWFLNGLRVAGGLFILYLAWGALKTVQQPETAVEVSPDAARQSFWKTVGINLLNPNVYIFWSTIGVPIVLEGWQQSAWMGAAFILGMYAMLIPVTAGLIVLFGTAGRLKSNWQRVVNAALAVLLVGVGLYQIFQGVSALINGG
jgi:threonine/homoserine/homoserine lactone efflux protein